MFDNWTLFLEFLHTLWNAVEWYIHLSPILLYIAEVYALIAGLVGLTIFGLALLRERVEHRSRKRRLIKTGRLTSPEEALMFWDAREFQTFRFDQVSSPRNKAEKRRLPWRHLLRRL